MQIVRITQKWYGLTLFKGKSRHKAVLCITVVAIQEGNSGLSEPYTGSSIGSD